MQEAEARQTPPATAQVHNAGIVASFAQNAQPTQARNDECVLESVEYRRAFMNFVQRGTPIPAELGTRLQSTDRRTPYSTVQAMRSTQAIQARQFPLTIMREIINTVRKRYGNLYDRVNKMSVQGGVEIPDR